MRASLIVLACAAALLLPGCLGNSVTISGQGGSFGGTESKTADCAGSGRVIVGIQGGGSLTVVVDDADGDEIFRKSFSGGGQDGESGKISGTPGEWTLRVTTNGAFGGQYTVTLKC